MTASHSTRRGGGENKKMVKNMKTEKTNEQSDNVAAIGIGAMIVFIALILVAAVAASVPLLPVGFWNRYTSVGTYQMKVEQVVINARACAFALGR